MFLGLSLCNKLVLRSVISDVLIVDPHVDDGRSLGPLSLVVRPQDGRHDERIVGRVLITRAQRPTTPPYVIVSNVFIMLSSRHDVMIDGPFENLRVERSMSRST